MKRCLIASVALSLLAGTAATAQPYGGPDRHDERRMEQRHDLRDARRDLREDRRDLRQDRREFREERRWARGQRLPRDYYAGSRYYVNDYGRHGLRAPPRGYRWYRTGNDYVLAAAATGLIASVIAASR